MKGLAELVGVAITNAENRREITASRKRLVAATDETRRRIEQDLHDGPKQGLVSVVLELRMIEDRMPDGAAELRDRIGAAADELSTVLDELRSITRQLHPAILAEGGLESAVTMLARRSSIPVDLDIGIDGRLPAPVEVAAYRVVDEAIRNSANNALATRACAALEVRGGILVISVHDNGVGGADPHIGPALVGWRDLVEALGGTIEVAGPPDAGTSVQVMIPVQLGDGVRAAPIPEALSTMGR
jgi:signal transduction histidine kinase